MKIALFGATGQTGQHILRMSLEKGHHVIALVRNPAKLEIQEHTNLDIISADALDIISFENHLNGVDAVISAIGPGRPGPTSLLSQGVRNMISAMQPKGVKRIVCIAAYGVDINPNLSFARKFLLENAVHHWLKETYKEYRLMEEQLKASRLDWTSIRPPMLTNQKFTGKYRFAVNDWLPDCTKISRADLAHFIVRIIDDNTTFKSVIEVAN